MTPLLGNGTELPVLPPYVWNERIITDTLSPSIDEITQVIILNPVECFVFKGCQSRSEGFSLEEATGIATQLHGSYDHQIGQRIHMRCVPHTLRDVRTELKVARESVREMLRGWAWHAHLLTSSPPLRGIQNVAGDTYDDQIGTLLVSTYCKRRGRGIAMKRRIVHIEDTMRPGQMLPIPIGSMPGILQLTCMLEQRVQSTVEDTP